MSDGTNVAKLDSALPATIADMFDDDINDDLESGGGGFATVSLRGKVWRIKSGGDEHKLMKDDSPIPTISVVLIKAQNSKTYYASKYNEGDDEAPDCFSINGLAPDAQSERPQSDTCAACPQNIWGSRMTDEGNKSRACPDSKRVAVVPATDLANEVFGGPMMLRIPAASLKDLNTYAKGLKSKGYPYPAVVTRLGFDPDVSYPKITFKAVRPLTAEEAHLIKDHLDGDVVKSIMTGSGGAVATTAPTPAPSKPKPIATNATVDTDFEEQPEDDGFSTVAAEPEPKKPAKKRAAKKKPAPAPEPEPASNDAEAELDDILSSLEAGDD